MRRKDNFRQPAKLDRLMTLVRNEQALEEMIRQCEQRVDATAAVRDSVADDGTLGKNDRKRTRSQWTRQTELLEHLCETLRAVQVEAGVATNGAACEYGGEFSDEFPA